MDRINERTMAVFIWHPVHPVNPVFPFEAFPPSERIWVACGYGSLSLLLDICLPALEIFPVSLPYKIATLLYCFDAKDHILLLERAQEPNRGFWSPPGGKLKMEIGESPYVCACREAREETGLVCGPGDLHLTGIISEYGYQGRTHWLMFLFEVKVKVQSLPPTHAEGRFQFFSRNQIAGLKIPQTDREKIWPWFWQYRGGFFAAHCHCRTDDQNDWTLEQARPGQPG